VGTGATATTLGSATFTAVAQPFTATTVDTASDETTSLITAVVTFGSELVVATTAAEAAGAIGL
jgi:hypothetical protein